MPKITVEFQLPEEQEEFDMYYIASTIYCALSDIQTLLRDIEKGRTFSEEECEEMYSENLFDKIRELIPYHEMDKIS